ncbi:hypothetical protein B0T20DRAFT_145769 [Sordaria brevicollis]|uniref:Uncharacterized protein n=1 Tax=Sordaria brevicollis TaxID=83679 RepID=A0AAE0PI99_SORBR|nr:hypothetical protein B0T20DRAFT_145769 [Sordaria brevicollis]
MPLHTGHEAVILVFAMSSQSNPSHHSNAQARVHQAGWITPSHQSQTSQFGLHSPHSTPQLCYEESNRQDREPETSRTTHEELHPENLMYLAEEHELDSFDMEQRNHNGLVIQAQTSQTVSGKVSFKQILEKAMNNVSDQLMALLEEELDNMEDEIEDMDMELMPLGTQRDSKL